MWLPVVIVAGFFQIVSTLGQNEVVYDMPSNQKHFRFIKEPADTVVLSQVDEVKLNCEAAFGNEPINYTWYKLPKTNKQRVDIVNSTDYTYVNDGLLFDISWPHSLMSGSYQCLANSSEGSIWSRTATLTIAYVQRRPQLPRKPITVVEYGGAVIYAGHPTLSPPDLDYSWTKNNTLISSSSSSTFISRDGHIYFSEVALDDKGDYASRAMFRKIEGHVVYLGNASANIQTSTPVQLDVSKRAFIEHDAEIVDEFPKVFPAQPKLGQTVELECVAFGSLPIQYSWTYKGNPISNDTSLSEGNRRLTIVDVQFRDQGDYACMVSNRNNTILQNKTFNLEIGGRPLFSLQLNDVEMKSNSFYKLKCLSSTPRATITWFKDGMPIHNITNRYHTHNKTLIIFTPTIGRDDGIYQCAAQNSYGITYSTAKVTIKEVPKSTNHGTRTTSSFSVLVLLILHTLSLLRNT